MEHLYDAIIIPGGGVREDGALPSWVKSRLELAVEIHRGEIIIALSAGTVHKPNPTDSDGFPIFESMAGARFLMEKGIDPAKILIETASYDTIGNAYFSRFIHAEPRGLRRLLIITSQFHMPRVKEIFQWVYELPVQGLKQDYQLKFMPVADANENLDDDALTKRREKEAKGLVRMKQLRQKLTTIEAFHRWLFTEHGAYAVATPPVRLKGAILSTY